MASTNSGDSVSSCTVTMQQQDNNSDWQTLYHESQAKYATLKGLSQKVADCYDDILVKYRACQEDRGKLIQAKTTLEEKFDDLTKLLEPVWKEYQILKTKYQIEADCRFEAEKYASKITRENKELRRRSQDLLRKFSPNDLVAVDIEIDKVDGPSNEESEERQHYQNQIDELQDQIAELKLKNREVKEELSNERHKYNLTMEKLKMAEEENKEQKESLKQFRETLEEFRTVYEKSYNEYEDIRKKYLEEKHCRNEAEKYAKKLHQETEVIKRRSNILMCGEKTDVRVSKALKDMEDLNKEHLELKSKHEKEVLELKCQLDKYEKNQVIPNLQKKNQELEDLTVSLEKSLTRQQQQYELLLKKYTDLEKVYEDSKRPPPPPPPPPLPPVPDSKGFLSRWKKKKSRNTKPGEPANEIKEDVHRKALEEMMNRIKDGRALTGAKMKRQPSCQDRPKDEAIDELKNLMGKMKRTKSESCLRIPQKSETMDELTMVFQRIRKKNQGSQIDTVDEENIERGKNGDGQKTDITNNNGSTLEDEVFTENSSEAEGIKEMKKMMVWR